MRGKGKEGEAEEERGLLSWDVALAQNVDTGPQGMMGMSYLSSSMSCCCWVPWAGRGGS